TVGCVVVGKHARLDACFAPPSRLARARVYFRVKGAAPDWYFVEMARDAPCHAGILPRPKKELAGRRIEYYVDTYDRDFATSRTKEAEALVVSSAGECRSKLPVARVLDTASVVVYPSLPAGFLGVGGAGLGAGATAALVGGGALVVGGGVALAVSGSDDGASATTTTTTVPPPTLPPATTTTTTLATPGFNAVFKVFKEGALVEADPVVGEEPLALQFDMCETTGPYRIRYGILVDGAQRVDRCRSSITFTTDGVVAGPFASAVRRSATTRSYAVQMTIRSEGPNNAPRANRRFTVRVSGAGSGGGCSADTRGPAVSLTKPGPGSVYPRPVPYPVRFEAFADDSASGGSGIAFVEYKVNYPGPDEEILGPVTSGSPWPLEWTEPEVNAYLGTACAKFLEVQAYAQDGCGNATYSPAVQVIVNNTGPCVGVQEGPSGEASPSATLVSELAVPGGAGQVVANGEAAFPRAGRSPLAVRLVPGTNRVEATIVEARAGGTWRFELGAMPGYRPETLRVVAGDVARLDAESVTFRIHGRPGERAVFVFTGRSR
ncbi:MAG TPA: hypothetical protein VGB87_17850, partial [Vicinamibacteria bacterium]